jgi:hypothetical protein
MPVNCLQTHQRNISSLLLRPQSCATPDGTNCASSSCSGAIFNSFSTYDGLVRLYRAIDSSIYSFNAAHVLSEATQDVASFFSGVENSLFGDPKGASSMGTKMRLRDTELADCDSQTLIFFRRRQCLRANLLLTPPILATN